MENGRKNEDRIVNGYQLDSGQPWYAGLGYDRDPRFFVAQNRITAQCCRTGEKLKMAQIICGGTLVSPNFVM